MNPVDNPFSPGAGSRPPELAGRDEVMELADIMFQRLLARRSIQPMVMVGLRGVGKTVLLRHMHDTAKRLGCEVIYAEATEGKKLPEILVSGLRKTLLALSLIEAAKDRARRSLGALKAFVAGFGLTVGDVTLSYDPTIGVADSGDLEADLTDILVEVGEAAAAANKAVVIFVDELQILEKQELSALIAAVHRISQEALPVAFVGAGLPQVLALAGSAKSYAERLFEYPRIDALSEEAAIAAISHPAAALNVEFEADAVSEVLRVTERYPYFLQQWAYCAWNIAPDSKKITWSDVLDATDVARGKLDESFFRVRYDRCTPAEKTYMRALAELGKGTHRSGDVADQLGCDTEKANQQRTALIKKAMIYSPAHGDVCFTVPMFDEFMRREIPDFVPRG
ncbi:ATP-binding protein [Mesorhizobium sp.]|uniref:ATP-binding protein n=1 Tax=Mesorhizobium sp. TaxID=1871066 RepID=UPI000FE610CC|nr:ATP-binding protein [Mesorhizobium sp.]RWP03134.1 MAG: ATP-binding protein [Mesorhizobium sp.]